eukprot:CAMPEP_0206329440 /NCGR_PEP_ID=MMETSP0106_2-20121207/23199_1 /ASSEMBLY_ACC=CAM_ASM_000206 /TAXON_ID=81532 /ORGANISM="Acanthoeca-like sp., Strain 10tr" /LENGTH=128 /DNA_ID=CAMNT_0053762157 /DNA_START=76 /DNA_END=459 /DNA_ORIENTATION=-
MLDARKEKESVVVLLAHALAFVLGHPVEREWARKTATQLTQLGVEPAAKLVRWRAQPSGAKLTVLALVAPAGLLLVDEMVKPSATSMVDLLAIVSAMLQSLPLSISRKVVMLEVPVVQTTALSSAMLW